MLIPGLRLRFGDGTLMCVPGKGLLCTLRNPVSWDAALGTGLQACAETAAEFLMDSKSESRICEHGSALKAVYSQYTGV